MAYVKQTWLDSPITTTPLSAARMNRLETQYDEAVLYTNAAIASNPGPAGADSIIQDIWSHEVI